MGPGGDMTSKVRGLSAAAACLLVTGLSGCGTGSIPPMLTGYRLSEHRVGGAENQIVTVTYTQGFGEYLLLARVAAETDSEVRVEIERTSLEGPAIGIEMSVDVLLQEELGDRIVIDDAHGTPVPLLTD